MQNDTTRMASTKQADRKPANPDFKNKDGMGRADEKTSDPSKKGSSCGC